MKKKAFTLVELMVVMVLIGILSSMAAVMLASVKTEALKKKTQRQIDVIEQILLSRTSDMAFSPVPLVFPVATSAPTSDSARLRLMARRDQLRMTFPDRRSDLLHPPTALKYWTGSAFLINKIRPPAAWARMRTKLGLDRPPTLPPLNEEISAGGVLPGGAREDWGRRNFFDATTHVVFNNSTTTPEVPVSTDPKVLSVLWTLEHESAECLYLILAVTEFNGTPALDLLGPTAIANMDGDMVPEIIDAWGQPLAFVRWPVGAPFRDIQGTPPDNLSGPDAFDYSRADHRFRTGDETNDPFNLTPMIVSSGADREFGVRLTLSNDQSLTRLFSFATTLYTGPTLAGWTAPANYYYPDPYYNIVQDGNAGLRNDIDAARNGNGLGATILPDDAADNITNFGS